MTYTYSYDADGNLLTRGDGTTTKYDMYNPANQICNESTTAAPTGCSSGWNYDASGDLTTSPAFNSATAMTYTPSGQVSAVTPTAAAANNYGYNGSTNSALITDTRSGTTTTFNLSQFGMSSRTGAGGTTYYTRTNGGELVSEKTTSGSVYYYVTDGSGNVIDLVSGDGTAVAAKYTYDPFGGHLTATGPANPSDLTVAQSNIWGFASGMYDANTGLYRFGQRYYDPAVGRWTQQDSVTHLGDPTQGNAYGYAGDDPVNNTDPQGTTLNFSVSGCFGVCINIGTETGDNGTGLTASIGAGPEAGLTASGTVSTSQNTEKGGFYGAECNVGPTTYGLSESGSSGQGDVGLTTDTAQGCQGMVGYSTGPLN